MSASSEKELCAFLRAGVSAAGGSFRRRDGVFEVRFPREGAGAELAERLGDELALVLDPGALAPGRSLLAPGSHVLRALDAWLAARGRRSYVVQPGRARLTKKALRERVRPARGAELGIRDRASGTGYDLYVVYRLRFRSLGRQEDLVCVRVRLRPGRPPRADFGEPPAAAFGWPHRPRKRPPEEFLDAGLGAADAFVEEHARAEAARRREDARTRFAKDVLRLDAYYAAQMAEVQRSRRTDLGLVRLEELQEERALRLAELARACEVSVEVAPMQVLCVEVPLQLARLVVQAEGAERAGRSIALERASGALDLGECPACAQQLAGELSACDGSHVVHSACLGRCDRCGGAVCGACESPLCTVCGVLCCTGCGATCPACGASACATHAGGRCARCESEGCGACLRACGGCGALHCDQHLADGLCASCRAVCPSCRSVRPRGELRRCDGCGRRFCTACLLPDAARCVLCP
ncbi:MAG: hypothetical protein D6731_15610 [Planctomycetota bacterium]|nr:MAG: hypothetical protein D6731_15610 [Planctomycetota bacterium]